MKPQFYLVLVSIVLLTSLHSTQAQDINQGLIALYCLDGNANDASGTMDGTLMNGATGTPDRANNSNGAVRLDGIDDFIQLPADQWITGDFSFSGWINIKSVGSWPHLWGFGNGTNSENVFLSLGQGVNNQPHFTTHACENGASFFRVNAPTASPLNTWFHIAITMVGSDVSIYKDNVLWVSETTSILPCSEVKDSSFIGKSNFTNNNNSLVDADIDDFRFYNRLLSQQEITQLYEVVPDNRCIFDGPTSIFNLENTIRNIQTYPNPTTGNFTINLPMDIPIERLKIYDLVGSEIVFKRTNNEIYLPSTIAKGIYHVQGLLKDGSKFTSRLLVN